MVTDFLPSEEVPSVKRSERGISGARQTHPASRRWPPPLDLGFTAGYSYKKCTDGGTTTPRRETNRKLSGPEEVARYFRGGVPRAKGKHSEPPKL